jgi:hypothetical protein
MQFVERQTFRMKDLIDSLTAAFDTLNDKHGFRTTLLNLLHDISEGKISYTAFRHKLEFICLEVSDLQSTDSVIRFHIWDREISADQEYHNHRYDFKSYVLLGSLLNEIASVVEDPKGEFAHVVVRYDGITSERVPSQKRFSVNEIKSFIMKEGDFYELNCNDFHRSLCVTIPTVTVFAMDLSAQKDTAEVIIKKAINTEVSIRIPVDDNSLRGLLGSILAGCR